MRTRIFSLRQSFAPMVTADASPQGVHLDALRALAPLSEVAPPELLDEFLPPASPEPVNPWWLELGPFELPSVSPPAQAATVDRVVRTYQDRHRDAENQVDRASVLREGRMIALLLRIQGLAHEITARNRRLV